MRKINIGNSEWHLKVSEDNEEAPFWNSRLQKCHSWLGMIYDGASRKRKKSKFSNALAYTLSDRRPASLPLISSLPASAYRFLTRLASKLAPLSPSRKSLHIRADVNRALRLESASCERERDPRIHADRSRKSSEKIQHLRSVTRLTRIIKFGRY